MERGNEAANLLLAKYSISVDEPTENEIISILYLLFNSADVEIFGYI